MTKHFTQVGAEYRLSPAAVIVIVADAIRDKATVPEGRARAHKALASVLAAARAAKYEQVDILETMLSKGADLARMLQMCDALALRVGARVVIGLVRDALGDDPGGGA